MGSKTRNKKSDLNHDLSESARRWNFFNAVRQIECANSDMPRIGHSEDAVDDPVRFCQKPTLAFSGSAIDSFDVTDSDSPPKMNVNFFGLLGPNGPMPRYITDYAHSRRKHRRDPTLSRFFDLFNHRLASLFYRAWACHQQTVDLDRPADYRWGIYLSSLSGTQLGSDVCPDIAKIHYSGRLIHYSKHARGLKSILESFFQISPIEVNEFCGFWLTLPEEYQFRLGVSPDTGKLGESIICGRRVWDTQQKFRIVIGPVNLTNFRRFLPGAQSLQRLIAWVRTYVGRSLRWDIQVILKAKSVPKTQLGKKSRLGLTTWLLTKTPSSDSYDLVFIPDPDK